MITNLPSITIVTPSLNQGGFIEEAIQSVLSQDYPHLEYIIADGGSTDHTIHLLEKYSKRIIWFSEKDKGQTNAINRALQMATGEVVGYLNADDLLLPGSLLLVGKSFARYPVVQWLTGQCKIVDETGKDIRSIISFYKNLLLYSHSYHMLFVTNYISQPTTFWRRGLLDRCGLLDESLHYVMDYEYWLRLWKTTPPLILHKSLAAFRIQRNSKTTSSGHLDRYIEEERRIISQHTQSRLWRS
ncbi:MAG TPA: glycosyltransferase family 2 protein, partial [Anaerolineales bacterium]